MVLRQLEAESTWDAKAKKSTGTMEGPGMTGEVVKMRTVVDADAQIMTLQAGSIARRTRVNLPRAGRPELRHCRIRLNYV